MIYFEKFMTYNNRYFSEIQIYIVILYNYNCSQLSSYKMIKTIQKHLNLKLTSLGRCFLCHVLFKIS